MEFYPLSKNMQYGNFIRSAALYYGLISEWNCWYAIRFMQPTKCPPASTANSISAVTNSTEIALNSLKCRFRRCIFKFRHVQHCSHTRPANKIEDSQNCFISISFPWCCTGSHELGRSFGGEVHNQAEIFSYEHLVLDLVWV